MKKILLIILVAFITFACSKEEGSVTGIASADDGNVLSGITVKLYTDNAMILTETTTDSNGNYTFSGLEEGNYYIAATITVDGEVWDSGNTPQMVFVSDEISKIVNLTLRKK